MSKQAAEFAKHAFAAQIIAESIAGAADDFFGKSPEEATWSNASEVEAIFADLVDVASRIERAFPDTIPASAGFFVHAPLCRAGLVPSR